MKPLTESWVELMGMTGVLIICRDIEAGLGEEWAAKGRMGSAERPHWGHNFWHGGSHAQTGQVELSRGQHDPTVPLAPVAEGASASVNNSAGNGAVNTAQPTGWV